MKTVIILFTCVFLLLFNLSFISAVISVPINPTSSSTTTLAINLTSVNTSMFVPYTGAINNVDLNNKNLITDGKIGIGTDVPIGMLEVKDSASTAVTISSGVGNENATIEFREADVLRATIEYSGLNSILRIWSKYADGVEDVLMSFNVMTNEIIMPSGNVNIYNNLSVGNNLNVTHNINLEGSLCDSGVCYTLAELNATSNASGFVPYTGAINNVDLGNHNLTAANLYLPIGGRMDFDKDNVTNAYIFFNTTSRRVELWANGKLQQDWGNSTTVYGSATFIEEATFYANAFFSNLSGGELLISANVIVNGSLIATNITASNICYSNGTNCVSTTTTTNPFNQVLNTTSNVTFNYLNVTGELIVNKSVRWLESSGVQNLFYINPIDGDGFRMEYWYDFEAPNDDWLVFRKTDGNDVSPDGGIAFMISNLSGWNKTILKLDGYGNANFTDQNITTTGNIQARGYSISTNGSWKWAWNIPHNSNDNSLCFQQSGLYYQGTANAMCLDTSSGKSLLKNNGPGSFEDSLYVGAASTYSALSNVTTKAGMFLPTKYVGVDSVAGGDSGFVFGYENTPMWDWSTFVAESGKYSGKYLHLINYQAGHDALTIGSSGRIGINKPSNVMNYHNGFNGTGLNDMYVGGTFTGGFNDGIEINVTSTANPNTFAYRVTVQNGATSVVGSWSAPINMDTSPVEIFKGITVRWDAVTGHTLGDTWQFNAFPANPSGTFTIKPTAYSEVIYYDGANYFDYTFPAGTSALGSYKNNPFTIFGTTGKYVYVGRYVQFSTTQFGIATPATGLNLKTEYWNGAAWTTLTAATNYLIDETVNLTKTGGVLWDRTTIANWATNVSVDTYNSTTGIYWIRYSSTSAGTAPTIDTITPQAIDRIAIYQSGYDINPSFAVAPNGDTVIAGTLQANGFYAELYNGTLSTQSLGNNVWENITNFVTGDLSGWNVTSGRILTCKTAGLYDISYVINGAVAGNDVLNYQVLVNGVAESKGDVTMRYSNGLINIVTSRFLRRFNATDTLYLQVRDTSSARIFTYDNRNMVLVRIGN